MSPAPTIYIIGDDATNNLLSAFVLKRFFTDAEISFLSDPATLLRDITATSPNGHTYIFLDTVTRGMPWHFFVHRFSELDFYLRKAYTLFMPLPDAYSALFRIDVQFPDVNVLPKPLSLQVLHDNALQFNTFDEGLIKSAYTIMHPVEAHRRSQVINAKSKSHETYL